MAKIIYALNDAYSTPSSWTIAQDSVMAEKPGQGMKFINYYKGADTCFVEDITNKDLKPSKVPDFTYDPAINKTVLEVEENNYALNNYLRTHSWFGTKVVIYSAESEAQNQLSYYEKIEKALALINESEDDKIRAIALAVLDLGYFYKTVPQCLADLKDKAFKTPDAIIDEMEADDYQNKYIAALAFSSGIIKNNLTNTAVVWSDTEGLIVHVAQGENGLLKLTEFLKRDSKESDVLLQEFQSRLDRKAKEKKVIVKETIDVLKAKDSEIEKLKKQLEALKAKDVKVVDTVNVSEEVSESNDTKLEDLPIEELQDLYVKTLGKELSFAYKNNKDWIIKQLTK